MSAIVTELSRVYASRAFLASLGSTSAPNTNSLYIFIGRCLPWTSADGLNASDTNPPYPADTVAGHIKVWASVEHLKQINPSDCTLVIQRFDWTENIIYTQYDQDIDLLDPTTGMTPFYVMTEDFNVYKCLFNNNNNPSYVEPTGTSTNIIQTADGYYWKYMFTVSTSDQQNFLTNEWIPVKTLTVSDTSYQWDVQETATPGSIDIVQVVNQGFGYVTPPALTFTGDGTAAAGNVTVKNGQVVGITMTSPGKNYTFAGATVSSGQVTSATVTNPGTGYISVPVVNITGDGSGATGHAVLVNSMVSQVIIDTPGSNYTTATISIAPGPGVQALALATVSGGVVLKAIIPPPGGHGSDPVDELGGIFAMCTAQLQFNESGEFTVDNDFRTLGIISNPFIWNATEIATGPLYSQAWVLPLVSVVNSFTPDDLIVGLTSGATGVVLDYGANGSGLLRVVNVVGQFLPGETIQDNTNTASGTLQLTAGTAQAGTTFSITLTSGDSGTALEYDGATVSITSGRGTGQVRVISQFNSGTKVATISESWTTIPDSSSHYSIAQITYPGLQPNTGQILYIENRRPITRAASQFESIAPVLEF